MLLLTVLIYRQRYTKKDTIKVTLWKFQQSTKSTCREKDKNCQVILTKMLNPSIPRLAMWQWVPTASLAMAISGQVFIVTNFWSKYQSITLPVTEKAPSKMSCHVYHLWLVSCLIAQHKFVYKCIFALTPFFVGGYHRVSFLERKEEEKEKKVLWIL